MKEREASGFFGLFGLEPRYAQSERQLAEIYRALAASVHPDRFVRAAPAERQHALEYSARVNEAYRVLRSPVARAQHLLEIRGSERAARDTPRLAMGSLLEQMELRERLAEAGKRADLEALDQLEILAQARAHQLQERLAEELDESFDADAASQTLQELLFIDKLSGEISDGRCELEDAWRC
jgi:molecular chaperone HscB